MARVFIQEPRLQEAHFGLYRSSIAEKETYFVRRKVGEPTDYLHKNCRTLQRIRYHFGIANQHWAHLTPGDKANWRKQARIVNRIAHASPSEEILLKGRQLFIHDEMASLETTGEQLKPPREFCIVLCDPDYNPLQGDLDLKHRPGVVFLDTEKQELEMGNWLFSNVPQTSHEYRVEGEADGFFDPKTDESQHLSLWDLQRYHYHILQPFGVHRHVDQGGQAYGYRFLIWMPIDCDSILAINETHTDVYEGIMKFGWQTYETPYLEDTWIRYAQHEVKLTDPFPNHLNFWYHDLGFHEGDPIWWSILFIPFGSMFTVTHTDLYFMEIE